MNLWIFAYSSSSSSRQYFIVPSLRLNILGYDTYKNTLLIIPNL